MASRVTSRHHLIDVISVTIIPIRKIFIFPRLNHITRPAVIIKAPKAAVRGHGLWFTK